MITTLHYDNLPWKAGNKPESGELAFVNNIPMTFHAIHVIKQNLRFSCATIDKKIFDFKK